VELVKNDPDVILVNGTSVTLAAHRATSTIPIIMAPATDPVLAGVLTSLSHPGGNVTGVMINTADITAKRIQLLKEIIPAAHRIGAFYPGEARANPVNAFDLWLFARAGLQPSRQP
jgi:putative ABC transport system substrate-binding protein